MTARDEIWAFAVKTPDYWSVLTTAEESAPLKALGEADRGAFRAARRVVQERVVRLVRACHLKLKARAPGTVLSGRFDKKPQDGSILAAKVQFKLVRNKAWLGLELSKWSTTEIGVYLSVSASGAWHADAGAKMPSANADGNWFWYGQAIDPLQSDADAAKALLDQAWNEVLAYQVGP